MSSIIFNPLCDQLVCWSSVLSLLRMNVLASNFRIKKFSLYAWNEFLEFLFCYQSDVIFQGWFYLCAVFLCEYYKAYIHCYSWLTNDNMKYASLFISPSFLLDVMKYF